MHGDVVVWPTALGTISVARPTTTTVWDLWASAVLDPDERLLAQRFGERRRRTFVMGRAALRAALAVHHPAEPVTIARSTRGAPSVSQPTAVSITHKDDVASALVRPVPVGVDEWVGLDLEHVGERDRVALDRLAAQILTERERAQLVDDAATRARQVMTSFSLKEAVYKAIDPTVGRYVGFLEVEVMAASGAVPVPISDEVVPYRVDTSRVLEAGGLLVEGFAVTMAAATALLPGSVLTVATARRRR